MRLGGKKLADYDGERNRFYEASGFVAESRADFDPKQAPKGWDYEKQGKPDILFWRYAGEEAAQAAKPTDVESLWKSNYEVAEEWRDTEIRKAEEENANKTVEEEKQPVNEHMVDKNGIMKEDSEYYDFNHETEIQDATDKAVSVQKLVKQSTCTTEELYRYLSVCAGAEAATNYQKTGNWPEGVQIPKSSAVLNAEGDVDWDQAPQNGYTLNADGTPKRERYTIRAGEIIDRFGGAGGRYVCPVIQDQAFTYSQRSLPYIENSADYHRYKVIGDFAELEAYIADCMDAELKAEITEYVEKYYNGDYSTTVAYRGEAAAVQGWGEGGAIQYELPLKIEWLIQL